MKNDFKVLSDNMQFSDIQADSLGLFAKCFLEQTLDCLQKTLDCEDLLIGKVSRKYVIALKRFLECRYLPDYEEKSIREIAIENEFSLQESIFKEYLQELVIKPFVERSNNAMNPNIASLAKELSGTVLAINGKSLREQVGGIDEKLFAFVLTAFRLDPINYHFESFRDNNLETLYSNDGLSLNQEKTNVKRFFRFFIDGEALKGEAYDAGKYYGCLPVAESRIRSYCKDVGISDNIVLKLMGIVKCSKRFDRIEENGETKYSLKIQYLNNQYAYYVAILYKEGKPLHKDVLLERVEALHNQYPNLVRDYSAHSIVLRGDKRAKPILCASSTQGEWKLQTWSPQRDILQDIRDFVSEVYARSLQPVPLEEIAKQMKKLGHTYPIKTLRTYVTKSGCVGKRGSLYVPHGYTGDVRFWTGKLYLIQRYAAVCLLESGRSSSRRSLQDYVLKQSGHPVNISTLSRALDARRDLFSVSGTNKRNQLIVLSDNLGSKRDVNMVIPEPEKQEQDYVRLARKQMIDYLFEKQEELQINMTTIFLNTIPKHIKARDSILRKILNDTDVFQKRSSNEKRVVVSLQPAYRARMEMERAQKEMQPRPQEDTTPFSWEVLKEGVVRQLIKDDIDTTLSSAVDNMFFIMRGGKEELLPNSNFKRIVDLLFKYVTSYTTAEERRDLQSKMLSMMEAFFREFHRLKYENSLFEIKNFGPLKVKFQNEGLLPDKNKELLSPEDLSMYYTIESINRQRNQIVGHPGALAEQSDKQSSKNIHDCLSVMAYLGRQLKM